MNTQKIKLIFRAKLKMTFLINGLYPLSFPLFTFVHLYFARQNVQAPLKIKSRLPLAVVCKEQAE